MIRHSAMCCTCESTAEVGISPAAFAGDSYKGSLMMLEKD